MKTKARCPYCRQWFVPSPYRPSQTVCSQPSCQRQRHNHYRRDKKKTDPAYRQSCIDSQSTWRHTHPDYMTQYRQQHPESVKRNRQRALQRYHQRRLGDFVKSNLAFDLKAASPKVFLIGPSLEDFVKNNVAFSQVYLCQGIT